MAPNFIGCDRELAAERAGVVAGGSSGVVCDRGVAAMDLETFVAAYRVDGSGRPAHDPAMMLALLLYARAIGERSSRRIERRCVEDVATRVICANRAPDHTTIARFRPRHESALAGVFGAVLGSCAEAGLVRVGVVAIDGTKVNANASRHATRDSEQIARAILDHAAEIDALEDERFGERRGDELPPALATREGRQRWLRDARRRLTSGAPRRLGRCLARGPSGWSTPSAASKEDLAVECRANAEYEAYRARGVMKDGRRSAARRSPTSHRTRRRGRST
jgi:transposase